MLHKGKVSSTIESQIPSHIKEDYPLFVQFIKHYYEFLEQPDGALGALGKLIYNKGIDDMPSEFVVKLKQELALPLSIAQKDSNVFSKNIKDLYLAKGTEESIRILFRLLFNEEVLISYPKEQILRASDGKWSQESFITVERNDGDLPLDLLDYTIRIHSDGTSYNIVPKKVEKVSPTAFRIYFSFLFVLNITEGDRVEGLSSNLDVFFVGKVVASPNKINILVPGTRWQVGKVFNLDGSVVPSIARATKVGPSGELLQAEIIQYGYTHQEGKTYYISPIKKPLLSSAIEVESVVTGIDPLTFEHSISVTDFVDSISENLTAYSDTNSYFLEDYVQHGYAGEILVEQSNVYSEEFSYDSDITYEEWLKTRTLIMIDFNEITKTVGNWKDDSGQVSNQFVRLQDNYFYQIFSYLIETEFNVAESSPILNLSNPAGLKGFLNENKTNIIDMRSGISVIRTISNEKIFLFDVTEGMSDSLFKNVTLDKDSYLDSGDIAESLVKDHIQPKTTEYSVEDLIAKQIEVVQSESFEVSGEPYADANVIMRGYTEITEEYFAEDYNAPSSELVYLAT